MSKNLIKFFTAEITGLATTSDNGPILMKQDNFKVNPVSRDKDFIEQYSLMEKEILELRKAIMNNYNAYELDLPAYCIFCGEMIENGHKEACVVTKIEQRRKV